MKLTISPFYCSSTYSGTDTTGCISDTTAKVKVYNKFRERFNIKVGAGLTVNNIVFDSLDSIVDTSISLPTCLS